VPLRLPSVIGQRSLLEQVPNSLWEIWRNAFYNQQNRRLGSPAAAVSLEQPQRREPRDGVLRERDTGWTEVRIIKSEMEGRTDGGKEVWVKRAKEEGIAIEGYRAVKRGRALKAMGATQ